MPRSIILTPLLLLTLLSACSSTPDAPTLESLAGKSLQIERNKIIDAGVDNAIDAYESVATADGSALNIKAMHRLADAEMKRIEEQMERGAQIDQAAYEKPIKWYQEVLKREPRHPQREEILYQLARAYEQSGDTPRSIRVLTLLARDYPNSTRSVEANFRRAEILFQEGRYHEAERAYALVISTGRNSAFYEQSLFKYAWSIYKQERCIDSLDPFFVILDRKLNRNVTPTELMELRFLSRADRELVEDSMRAINLCITAEGGPKTLNSYLVNKQTRVYEFLLYKSLSDYNMKQQDSNGAAAALSAFWERAPWHPYALLFHDDAIEIHTRMGQRDKIIPAKIQYVEHFDEQEGRWQNNEHNNYYEYLIRSDKGLKERMQKQLELHLSDLTGHYHSIAQQNKAASDYRNAIVWYRAYLKYFPRNLKAAEMNLRLADALFESGDYTAAAREYERVAYDYGKHNKAADAGYAALNAHEKILQAKGGDGHWDNTATQSALSFSRIFPQDPRAPAVLARAADELYKGGQYLHAVKAAESIMSRYPSGQREHRRTALMVLANTQFEQEKFEVAELFYIELQGLLDKGDPLKKDVEERIAACIYKQAEDFRNKGAMRSAVEQFQRLISAAPNSSVRPIAEFDIATTYIQINEWEAALKHLEAFKKRFPSHSLIKEVNEKIAIGYLSLEKPLEAASALEGITADMSPEAQREALWQIAELYEKAGDLDKAAIAYMRYADTFRTPLEPAVEALYKAAQIYRKQGRESSYFVQMEKINQLDRSGGSARTDRTRYLAALGTFELAEPHFQRYADVKLVEPIRKNMELKNAFMKRALEAYNKAAESGVAEFTTGATYRIADMYADFSRKLMESERPTELTEEELEQYELMLEEQAFPFEEKAIALHETNIKQLHGGFYNDWIKKSITALAKLMPARYSRMERHDVAAPAPQ